MSEISQILVVIIAILHIWFLILEMFLWDKPIGLKTFGLSLEDAKRTKTLAANQGLYNGFLAAGLIWGLVESQSAFGLQIKIFFLSCVFIAGVYGALTANKKILFIQAIPALIALIFVSLK